MKFGFPLLNGLQDAQQNFEQLESLDILDLTAEGVLQQSSGSQLSIAFGSVTISWPGGSPLSGTINASHGLGSTPVGLALTASFMSATPFAFEAFVNGTPSATVIPVQGNTPGVNPAAGTTALVYWIAIG